MKVFRINWQWLLVRFLWEDRDRKENSSRMGGKVCLGSSHIKENLLSLCVNYYLLTVCAFIQIAFKSIYYPLGVLEIQRCCIP